MSAAEVAVLRQGLPGSLDAERAVLGGVLLDANAFDLAAPIVQREDFSHEAHRQIYGAMASLADAAVAIDPVTLTEELIRRNAIESSGGAAYLMALTEGLPRSVNVGHYARIVREKAQCGRLIHVGMQAAKDGLDAGGDWRVIAKRLADDLDELLTVGSVSGPAGIVDVVHAAGGLDALFCPRSSAKTDPVPTGLRQFDQLTAGGLRPGDLGLIAARPSVGKTALALDVTRFAGCVCDVPVLVFSLEMGRESLVQRLACGAAKVDAQRARSGYLNRDEHKRLSSATARLSAAPIEIDDSGSLTIPDLRARARSWRRRHPGGPGLVVLDYLQLLAPPRAENRNQEISGISRALKLLAKELAVPVLALSQLSRAPETRAGDGRPRLSDLRDSGSLEQDADLVAFIHRMDYAARQDGVGAVPSGAATLIIAKQRNGPVGDVPLMFHERYSCFTGVVREK